jgi:hypothetical protein
MKPIVLEDALLRSEFDPATGALVGLVNKATGWRIHARPELGLSFRMMAPLPGRRNNPILGHKQRPPIIAVAPGGKRITMEWRGLLSEHGGELDIVFRAAVTLAGAAGAASTLTFEGEVANRSPHPVESVSWPCIGDLSVPSAGEPLSRMSCGYCGMNVVKLLPRFDGDGGYFGFDHPLQMVRFPDTPFVLAASDKQGLYAGCHDTGAEEALTFAWELKPGFETAFSEASGMVSATGQIDGRPNHLEFTVWHFPFAAPGETRKLSPIALAPYAGTWHKGVDVYKAWRKTCFTPPATPAWARDVHSWQQIHINSPEDELRCRYKDLPRYGEDCAKHGVKAIQLVGWNDGGQDRGNPSHDTDDRLGTAAELKEAIAKIQAMGVQLILFAKFTWADRSGEWFRKELVKYAAKDFYGDYFVHGGYRYQTPTQLADLNTRRLVPMCHCCAPWREIAEKELAKTMDLGAAGILYDEAQHHGGAIYCFDPTHGHRVPAHIYAGDATLAEGFRRLAQQHGTPDFLFAGEACYDLEYRHYSISYTRIGLAGPIHLPVQRYIDPQGGYMIAVTGFNDRTILNQCLLYRYIISYEPFNFKGRLDDFPRTMEYGKAVDDLRRRYRQFLWDGEFQDTLGAKVSVGGKELSQSAHAPEAAYTVYHDVKTGKRAVVVANFDLAKQQEVRVELAGRGGKLVWASPENPAARPTDGKIALAPASAAVVMEE